MRSRLNVPTSVGLVVALGGPPALAELGLHLPPSMGVASALQLAFCGLAILILLLVARIERLPLGSIGPRPPDWSTLKTAAALFLTGLLVQVLVIDALVPLWGRQGADAGTAALAVFPAWFRVVLGVTGGAVEETLYRGYAIERLATVTGRRWLGASLATIAFAAAHVPFWGLGFALAADLPAGIVLAGFYLWRRDLVANMLAHSAGIVLAMFTLVPPAV